MDEALGPDESRGQRPPSSDDVPRVVRPRRRAAATEETHPGAPNDERLRSVERTQPHETLSPKTQRQEAVPQGERDRPRAERERPRPTGDRPRPSRPEQPRPDRIRRESPDDEYVVLPRDTSAGRKFLTVALVAVLIVGAFFGGTLLWASRQIGRSGPQGAAIESLTIPSGASVSSIAGLLVENQVISNARVFKIYIGLKNKGGWKAGKYVDFRKNSSFDEAIEVLDAGPVAASAKVVRVIEGSRLVDALEQIAQQSGTVSVEDLQAALDSGQVTSAYKPEGVGTWEGLLFPDTYQFGEDDTAVIMLQKMVTKMDSVLDSLGYDRASVLSGRSAYELITIASLIERETGQPPEERGQISRVISNRLDAGERLEIDASVLYGLGRKNGSLTKDELEKETPYNTRKVKGLPPTPIALPGEASLKAAIEPTPGDWKFYVLISNDPPTHFFTSSYQEFLRQKADARKRGVF